MAAAKAIRSSVLSTSLGETLHGPRGALRRQEPDGPETFIGSGRA